MQAETRWKTYRDFIITIKGEGKSLYRVKAEGPTGQAMTTFTLPFDERDLKIFLLEVAHPRMPGTRGRVPKPMKPMVDFGARLFNTVISGAVRDVFVSARHDAGRGNYGLRLQLRLADAPDLAHLPWEFLYDGRDFLALSDTTPIVRHLDLPNPPRPIKVAPPLRLLVTISAPLDQPKLDVALEKTKVQEALAPLVASGMLQIDFAPDATLQTLQRTMRQAKGEGHPYHIWHYIGHGIFDQVQNASVIALCDKANISYSVGGFQLGTLFNSYPQMRLVLLNACEVARPDPQDPFAGVAAALVERGVPAVIGMQFGISNEAATTFAGGFYEALAEGLPVDAALTEARRSVFFLPNWVEWATPVLFMRATDGVLFQVADRAAPEQLSVPPPPVFTKEAVTAVPEHPVPERRAAQGQVGSRKGPPVQTQSNRGGLSRRTMAAIGGTLVTVAIALVFIAALLNGWPPGGQPTEIPQQTVQLAVVTTALSLATDTPLPSTRTPLPPTKTPSPPTPTKTLSPTPTQTPPPQAGDTWTRPADGMVMVYVPAGDFLMGSTDDDSDALDREKPQHTVYLDAFWIDKYEVTNAQYRKCVAAGACEEPGCWDEGAYNAPNQPVVCVDWSGAQAYATWVGGRLPTEAEWEKAARGTDRRLYPWGNSTPDCDKLNYKDCLGKPAEVGSYPAGASPYGAQDMTGNVWEWVADWYGEAYYANSPTQNPQGPDSGDYRLLRGGSWGSNAEHCRCGYRYRLYPLNGFNNKGFRCARAFSSRP